MLTSNNIEAWEKDKKGRSIRIRIETLCYVVLKKIRTTIKKEDPLE